MKHWREWPIKIVNQRDNNFPMPLKKIKKCPEKLYYRGNWSQEIFNRAGAIVGSRRLTNYGKQVLEMVVPEYVARKITVISGFMFGADEKAHRFCLEFGGKTIAILGSGLNYLYPQEHDVLYSEILERGGLVISEYEPEFKPTLWSFPQRNRIVAGLATHGVLVVEAGTKSGSLITADIANKIGKRVMAIPGPITSTVSAGCNWLIKNNLAEAIAQIEDIFEEQLLSSRIEQPELWNWNGVEGKIMEMLRDEDLAADEISRKLKLGIDEINSITMQMMMNDLLEENQGKLTIRDKGSNRQLG
jgi:DNA processing protein